MRSLRRYPAEGLPDFRPSHSGLPESARLDLARHRFGLAPLGQGLLELLDVQPGQRVLDVGSGSGWTTALLAELVGPTGSVLGLERVPDLVVTGAANVVACRMPWARVRAAVTGVLGAPDEAPFDRVLVSAMATRLPQELVAQLVGETRTAYERYATPAWEYLAARPEIDAKRIGVMAITPASGWMIGPPAARL